MSPCLLGNGHAWAYFCVIFVVDGGTHMAGILLSLCKDEHYGTVMPKYRTGYGNRVQISRSSLGPGKCNGIWPSADLRSHDTFKGKIREHNVLTGFNLLNSKE